MFKCIRRTGHISKNDSVSLSCSVLYFRGRERNFGRIQYKEWDRNKSSFFFFFGSDCPMVPSLNSAQSINKSKEDETKLRDICGTITYFHNFHDKADQL